MKKHVRLIINKTFKDGGFRFSCMEAAYRLGVRGYVKNNPDTTVYIEAEGLPTNIDRFVEWCRKGPIGSKVFNVDVEPGVMKNYETFDITLD